MLFVIIIITGIEEYLQSSSTSFQGAGAGTGAAPGQVNAGPRAQAQGVLTAVVNIPTEGVSSSGLFSCEN